MNRFASQIQKHRQNHPDVLPLALDQARKQALKEVAQDLTERLYQVSTLVLPPAKSGESLSAQLEMLNPNATQESLTAKGARDLGGPAFALKSAIASGKSQGPRIDPSGAMISQTSGHGDTRLPEEHSRRFLGKPSRGEESSGVCSGPGWPIQTAVGSTAGISC